MSKTQVVKDFMEAVNAADIDKAASLLADNYQFSGPVPEPIGKFPYVGLMRINAVAFPDWTFHFGNVTEDGNTVTISTRITGTHSGNWDLSPMGMAVIPATNKSFDLPPESGDWTVENGKITAFSTQPSQTSGMPGIMSQLGLG